jgi:hypothetical protein
VVRGFVYRGRVKSVIDVSINDLIICLIVRGATVVCSYNKGVQNEDKRISSQKKEEF